MIVEKFRVPVLVSELNYRVRWHYHQITMQILQSMGFEFQIL